MFKLCFALVAVASALDTEAPTISMDMSEAVGSAFPTKFSMECEVGARCVLPKQRGYDTNDKVVTVSKAIVRNYNDHTKDGSAVKSVDFNRRGVYTFTYRAQDKASNKAEPLVFKLKIVDTKAPAISLGCGNKVNTFDKSEADKDSKSPLCTKDSALDAYDGDVTKLIRYTITRTVKGVEQTICDRCTLAEAQVSVTGTRIGSYTINVIARDLAGSRYGKNGNNKAVSTYYLSVVDTVAPKITINGASPATTECGRKYVDGGSSAFDEVDGKLKPTSSDNVDAGTTGRYTVTYRVSDKSGNDKDARRSVQVTDTAKPSITLTGTQEVFHHSEAGFRYSDAGAVCRDACDGKFAAKGQWVSKFNDRKIASYTYRLTCTDKSGNKITADRKVTVVDKYAPIVKIVGADNMKVEASHTADFEDPGASCFDYIHGNLNNAVRIEGDTVDMESPGTYRINYECKDPAGHRATAATRFVKVQDTKCPMVKINGADVISIEAGFPFKDAGAKARDGFDGDITKSVTTSGDTVNVASAFTMSRSCEEIYAQGARKSGNYFIMATSLSEQRVFCDMKAKGRTFKRCSRCSRRSDSCARYGMKKDSRPNAFACKAFGSKYCVRNSNYYLCRETGSKFEVSSKGRHHSRINRAEQGKYVISYHVKDASGNKECKTGYRTVVVRDSLPPVITLHLQNKRIVPVKPVVTRNPATNPKVNPFLSYKFMAETASVNGWVIAAVASAVTGVSLLAVSAKKTATMVPV